MKMKHTGRLPDLAFSTLARICFNEDISCGSRTDPAELFALLPEKLRELRRLPSMTVERFVRRNENNHSILPGSVLKAFGCRSYFAVMELNTSLERVI